MYVPPFNSQRDMRLIRQFMREARLASLVTVQQSTPFVSHVPMLLMDDETVYGRLICHLALGNRQVQTLDGPALVTFLADEAYIHPGWYPSASEHGMVVPTYNYVAVHATGHARKVEDPLELRVLLQSLTDHHEIQRDTRWQMTDAPTPFIERMLQGIVGVEIVIDSLEAKWKLGQDESDDDLAGAIACGGTNGNREKLLRSSCWI